MEEFRMGKHKCLMHATTRELWQKIIPYMREGLKRGERVVYVLHDSTIDEVKAALTAVDKDFFETAILSGSLEIFNSQETYYQTGEFAPEAMLKFISILEKEAVAQGYKAVLVIGEMSWALEDMPGTDKLVDYERSISGLSESLKFKTICIYNESRFEPDMIKLMKRIHPHTI